MPVKISNTSDMFSQNLKDALSATRMFSKDVPLLEYYENHHVFVYGSLKRGCDREKIMSGYSKNKWCGIGITESPTFNLMMTDGKEFGDSNFPVAFENVSKERDTKLKGELWLVPTEMMMKLDQIEGNGYLFERVRRNIWVGKKRVTAWIYVGIKSVFNHYTLHDLPRYYDGDKGENAPRYFNYSQDVAKKIAKTPKEEEVIIH